MNGGVLNRFTKGFLKALAHLTNSYITDHYSLLFFEGGRTRISAKIYHKRIDPLYKPIEAMTTEAKSGVRNV
jgi:hypothetical protein